MLCGDKPLYYTDTFPDRISERLELISTLLELKHAGPDIAGYTDHPIPYAEDPGSLLWQRQLHHSHAREEADQIRPKEKLALRPLARDVHAAGQDDPFSFTPQLRNPFFIKSAALAELISVTSHLVFV